MTTDQVKEALNTKVAFNIKAGVELTDVEPGRVRGRLKDMADNTNHLNDNAAGAIFTLGELMPGALLIAELDSDQVFLVVKRVEIDFVGTGRGELVAECRLDDAAAATIAAFKEGKTRKFEVTLPVAVVDGQGKDVARLMGTYYVRNLTERLKKAARMA